MFAQLYCSAAYIPAGCHPPLPTPYVAILLASEALYWRGFDLGPHRHTQTSYFPGASLQALAMWGKVTLIQFPINVLWIKYVTWSGWGVVRLCYHMSYPQSHYLHKQAMVVIEEALLAHKQDRDLKVVGR